MSRIGKLPITLPKNVTVTTSRTTANPGSPIAANDT